jgi:uncharacterized protein (UPF0335 family)
MAKTNGYDTGIAGEFIERIQNLHGDLDSERGKYMAACKKIREDIKEVLAEAESEGFDKKVIKAIVKEIELFEKIKRLPDGFDMDTQSQYEALSSALGAFADTALGQAALDRSKDEARKSGAAAGTEASQPKAKKSKKDKAAAPIGSTESTSEIKH